MPIAEATATKVHAADRETQALQSHRLGQATVTLVPHHIEGIGPRLFLVIEESGVRYPLNLAPAEARELADYLKIAACQAEALERRAHQKAERRAAQPPAVGDDLVFLKKQAD